MGAVYVLLIRYLFCQVPGVKLLLKIFGVLWILRIKYAPVMELVDMRDLGSRAAMRVGSSPFRRTTSEQAICLLRLIL